MSILPSETHACAPATTRGRGTLLGAHAGKGVVCYANGKQIVVRSLSYDSRTVFYDGHQYPTTVARVSPNGEWVASGDTSGIVRIWGLNDDQTLKAEHRVLSGAVDDIQWSGDGQRVVACGDGRGGAFARAFLWDSGSSVGDISGATKRVVSVAFRPVRPFKIVAASEDFTVGFFGGPPFAFAGTKHKHGNFANCARYTDDGALFASVGSDGVGVVYDGATGAPLALCPKSARAKPFGGAATKRDEDDDGHSGSTYACAWSPNGRVLLTVGADKTAKAWDASVAWEALARAASADDRPGVSDPGATSVDALPRLAVMTTFRFSEKPGVNDMQVGCAFVGDDAVTLSLDGTLNVLDLTRKATGEATAATASRPARTVKGHARPVVALGRLRLFPEERSSGGGGDKEDGEGGDAATKESEAVATVSVSLAAVSVPGAPASAAFAWAPEGGTTRDLGHGTGAAVALASTRDGARLLSVGLDDTARVFFADSGASARVAALPGQPRDVAVSADGAVGAAACGNGEVAVFLCPEREAAATQFSATTQTKTCVSPALCVSVAADGASVFFGGADGVVRALAVETETGSRDGAGGRTSTIELRNDEGSTVARHGAEIVRLACSPTRSAIVASADASRKVFVHDVSSKTLTHENQTKLTFHAARITALAWSPDGRRLASGSLDGSVIVWDPWSGGTDRITVKHAHPGGVTSLVWRDDAHVCTGGFDACVRTWTV